MLNKKIFAILTQVSSKLKGGLRMKSLFLSTVTSIVILLVLSCGGGKESSSSQPIVHTNFAGNWKADELDYRATLNLNTSDNVHYTGTLNLTSKNTGLILTADISGALSWGFTQSPTICSSSLSRTWMITPFSNMQGHLFSSSDNISYADGTLWDYATVNYDNLVRTPLS